MDGISITKKKPFACQLIVIQDFSVPDYHKLCNAWLRKLFRPLKAYLFDNKDPVIQILFLQEGVHVTNKDWELLTTIAIRNDYGDLTRKISDDQLSIVSYQLSMRVNIWENNICELPMK